MTLPFDFLLVIGSLWCHYQLICAQICIIIVAKFVCVDFKKFSGEAKQLFFKAKIKLVLIIYTMCILRLTR